MWNFIAEMEYDEANLELPSIALPPPPPPLSSSISSISKVLIHIKEMTRYP